MLNLESVDFINLHEEKNIYFYKILIKQTNCNLTTFTDMNGLLNTSREIS